MKRSYLIAMMAVTVMSMAASSHAVPTFYLLNTEATNDAFRGRIDVIDLGADTRDFVTDVDPSPFGVIEDWRGFATDGSFFYYLNTDGGGAWPGRIDRTAMDGSGRTPVADIDPSEFDDIEDWNGFATDGNFFYLLNTGGTGAVHGQIDRVNLDGSGRTKIADLDPTYYGAIEQWLGFATDGQFFYLLNTEAGNDDFRGRIDRINMDGTGRTKIGDIDPDPFGVVEQWLGFAAPTVPEPATALLGMGGLMALGMRRRRSA